MSADNTVAIIRVGKKWFCKEMQNAFEIKFDEDSPAYYGMEEFNSKGECLDRALEITSQGYVEYGVGIMGEFN